MCFMLSSPYDGVILLRSSMCVKREREKRRAHSGSKHLNDKTFQCAELKGIDFVSQERERD